MRNNFLLVSALLRGTWLIEPAFAQAQLPLIEQLLDGASLQDDDSAAEAKELDPFFGCFAINLAADAPTRYKTFDEAPAGSTAVIGISGPILKDDWCDVGMNTKADQIRAAAAHPNISSIVLQIDSPGGQSNAPALAADAIRSARAAGTPVVAWVDHGYCASAAYWIAAACDEIHLSQATDYVGSVGGYRKYRKNADTGMGEVYAPQSTLKNLSQREADKGNTAPMEAEMAELVDEFIASVAADRGDRLAATGDHYAGALMMGKKAVACGLADGICSLDAAVARAQELAQAATETVADPQPTPPNPLHTMKFTLLCALLAVESLVVDDAKGSHLTADHLQALEDALVEKGTQATALATATTERDTARTALATATTRAETAEQKLTKYANVPAEDSKVPKQDGDDKLLTTTDKPKTAWEENDDALLADLNDQRRTLGYLK